MSGGIIDPLFYFHPPYNLPRKQIMTKVIEIVNLLLILYHFLDLDASLFWGFVTLRDIYRYIYIYIYLPATFTHYHRLKSSTIEIIMEFFQ